MKIFLRAGVLAVLLWSLAFTAHGQAFDATHAALDALLRQHVVSGDGGRSSGVRYAALAAERGKLQQYLKTLEVVTPAQFGSWPREQRLAFLINAYNAWTLELILTKYPDLDSIRDLGSLFQSPWKKVFVPLLGRTVSLDEIEHGMIRKPGAYDDPRIHFAVNCASVGCPALRAEAYVAARLESQLDEGVTRFLEDRSRNRYDAASDTLSVSKIFDWYGEDFERGWRGITSLKAFFAAQAGALTGDAAARAALRAQRFRIRFNDYDWALNDAR